MKKLLFLILLTPFAYADMDNICSISLDQFGTDAYITDQIRQKGCERNNVLQLTAYKLDEYTVEALLFKSAKFCRFDRNMDIKRSTLICVLYSTKPREYLYPEE